MRLPSIWSDHAVIQRSKPIIVWGWCDARRAVVRGTLGGMKAQGLSSWGGRFELRFPPLPPGGPHELHLACGKEEVLVRNIVVGEVWLVSGQSNAEYPLGTFDPGDPMAQTKEFFDSGGEDPLLRCFTVPNDSICNPGQEVAPGGEWRLSDPGSATAFTAIGAWFALFLRKKFPDVPVGIIHSSWGGSKLVAWLSREALAARPENRPLLIRSDADASDPKLWEKVLEGRGSIPGKVSDAVIDFEHFTQRDRGNRGYSKGYADMDFDDSTWKNMRIPGSWIRQNVSLHGAVWTRTEVFLPDEWAGMDLVLHLGGVDKHDTTYFNGTEVGSTGRGFETEHWDRPRSYPIPGKLVRSGRNVVAIRAFSFYFDGGFFGSGETYRLENPALGKSIPIAAKRWKAQAEYAFSVLATSYRPVDAPTDQDAPHRLFDNKIRPIIPYAIRGVLWYQGESDAIDNDISKPYLERFCDLIQDWRRAWAQGDFPFLYVQLANFLASCPDLWLAIQDAQRRASLLIPRTGVATANDLALFEPWEIHPHDKRSVAHRLYLLALSHAYGFRDLLAQGPTLDAVIPEGDSVRLHFLHAAGLHASGGDTPQGLELADADGNFHRGWAEIQGATVRLSSPKAPFPTAVRYNAQVDLPPGNLRNGAGLPALSFLHEI